MIWRLFKAWRDGKCVSCGCLLMTRDLPQEAFRCFECQLNRCWWAKPASKAYRRVCLGAGRLEILYKMGEPAGYRTQFGVTWWK